MTNHDSTWILKCRTLVSRAEGPRVRGGQGGGNPLARPEAASPTLNFNLCTPLLLPVIRLVESWHGIKGQLLPPQGQLRCQGCLISHEDDIANKEDNKQKISNAAHLLIVLMEFR